MFLNYLFNVSRLFYDKNKDSKRFWIIYICHFAFAEQKKIFSYFVMFVFVSFFIRNKITLKCLSIHFSFIVVEIHL